MKQRIYLDHAATSPLRPEAKLAMDEGFAMWANPSSPHTSGRQAKAMLEEARGRIKASLQSTGREVIFTSGASEAAALAMTRAKGGKRFVSAVEHDAVLNAAPDAAIIPVGSDGMADLSSVDLGEKPVVAVQHINSETGLRQDITAIAEQVHAAGGLLVVDCAQSAGKFFIPDACDMVIISAHKFGGPIGIGALLLRDYAMLEPSGGQERGYRRGTENLPAVMGMQAALECVTAGDPFERPGQTTYYPMDVIETLENEVFPALEQEGCMIPGENKRGIGSMIASPFAMPGMSGHVQVMQFDLRGIDISAGSACSSGTLKRSRVLEAMQLPPEVVDSTIRMSAGWNTTPAELIAFRDAWLDIARTNRQR